MEDNVAWHGVAPNKEQTEMAIAEIVGQGEVLMKRATRDSYGHTLVELGKERGRFIKGY